MFPRDQTLVPNPCCSGCLWVAIFVVLTRYFWCMCPLSRPTHIFGDLHLFLRALLVDLILPPWRSATSCWFPSFPSFSSSCFLHSFLLSCLGICFLLFFDPDNDFVWILIIFLLIHMLPQMAGQLPEAQTRDADWRRLRHYTNLGRSSMAIGGNQVVSIHFAGWWIQIVNDYSVQKTWSATKRSELERQSTETPFE